MSTGKIVGYSFLGLFVILFLTWVFAFNGLGLYAVTAPIQAKVERKVFENTVSYNQGMVQELSNIMREYAKADNDNERAILASSFTQRADGYGYDKLPSNLQSFYNQVNSPTTGTTTTAPTKSKF
jgi:hypothetical protein